MAEIERGETVAVLQEHREHRRHTARIGALIFRQRLEISARLVGRHQHEGAARMKHRLHGAAQRVLVEERQRHQPAIVLRGRPVALVIGDVPQHAAVGHDRALGAPGRSRRVGLERLRVVGDRRRRNGRSRLRHLRLEIEEALVRPVEQQPLAQRHALRDRERIAIARRVDQRERALRIRDDRRERVAGEPDIERQRNGAGAHRAKEELDELGAIADQHGDALARPHTQSRQHARDLIHARMERGIGRYALALAVEIDDGDLVRRARHRSVEEKTEIATAIVQGIRHVML